MLDKLRTFPTSPSDEQIAFTLKQLTYARIDNWLDTDVNTFGWWFQLLIALISLALWWKLVDRKRLLELTFYGFTVMTVSIWLDEVGYELGMWYYPIDIIPIFPPSTAIDYIMLPVIYALVYQYCSSWKSFITGIVLMSGIFSFGLEPLLEKFGFYVLVEWKFYYGFPIYITIGVVMKMVVEGMKEIIAKRYV